MDWARDHLGQLVNALHSGISEFGLVCPTCGEPVHRRSGPERRPHFAHYSHRAKPDCENYFPSEWTGHAIQAVATTRTTESRHAKRGVRAGLYLVRDPETDRFSIRLRLPSIELAKEDDDGTLRIESSVGIRSYSTPQMDRVRFIPLGMAAPLGRVTGTGALAQLAHEIQSVLDSFSSVVNVFSGSDPQARLMGELEPLEWGGRNLIVAYDMQPPPGEIEKRLEWSVVGRIGPLDVVAVQLPSSPDDAVKQYLAKVWRRHIVEPRPKAYVIEPLPHHVEIDGILVYAEAPNSFFIWRSTPLDVEVDGSKDCVSTACVRPMSEEWVRLEGIRKGPGEVVISLDGIEQVLLRFDRCEFFSPPGVKAVLGDRSLDLVTCPELGDKKRELIRLECPSHRVAAHLANMNDGWDVQGNALISSDGGAIRIDAGGFGNVGLMATPATDVAGENKTIKAAAKRMWVEALVLSKCGPLALAALRHAWMAENGTDYARAMVMIPAALLPYVRAAK